MYEIVSALGAGGMGEVYRARDTKLGRDVALKILPFEFTNDPERVARFQREAQVLASLNHPNIGAIYGLEEASGLTALVLELVEGQTLADRVARGPIPIVEALPIARQIAGALEAAHQKGIVHRDLKPANIKIRSDGTVKVLDFGLAKALEPGTSAATGTSLANSPTITSPAMMTGVGVMLGTAAYMSPEQARGQPVDKRADIWALGCVLFEMLTGRAAFSGETLSDIAARILEREPAWDRLQPDVPDGIRRLLKRCLRKDPADRVHDIADARIEIVDALSEPVTGGPDASRVRGKERSLWLALGLIAIAATVAVGLALGYLRGSEPSTGVIDFSINLGENTPGYGIAVSPDGRRIAIGAQVGARPQIWLQSLDASATGPLAGTEFGTQPFWSPDGSSLGFFANGKLQKIDPFGGPPAVICNVPGSARGSWNADGLVIFSSGGQLFRVPVAGGTPARVALADGEEEQSFRSFPQFLPDNRHFLYHVNANGRRAVYLGTVDGREAKHLVDSEFPATFAAPGYLLFVRGTALMAQAFDQSSLSLTGDASVVASNVAAGYVGGAPAFSASNNGVLAFVPIRAGNAGQLTWFDRTGRTLGSIQRPPGDEYLNPSISPGGDQVAVNRMDPGSGNWDIWTVDLARDVASRVTVDPAQDTDPVWSPDGKVIAFASLRGPKPGLYRTSLGSGTAELLLALADPFGLVLPTDWSQDGRFLLYQVQDSSNPRWSIWLLPLSGDRTPMVLLSNEFTNYGAHLSPDGNWIAYNSTESGTYDVYVQRFQSPGPKMRIARGVHPRWNQNGREIVFWSEPGGLTSVELEPSASGVRVGIPKPLISAKIPTLLDARPHYDFTRDGERFLIRQPAGLSGSTASVIVNWPAKLNK